MTPVTLLTGFLGAGKTTLLNRLMAARPDLRFAIVENEFGAAGIDGSLLSPAATKIVELSNGCICCSVRSELGEALGGLLRQRAAGELAFDHLVIETTGLADPGPVIQTFFTDDLLREAFCLDAVVTLIDVCHATRQLDSEAVAGAQVAYADWLILTKTDIADAGSLPGRLATLNAGARQFDVRELETHLDALLATGGFSLDGKFATRPLAPASTRNAFGQKTPTRSWDDRIHSLLLEADGELDLDAVSAFMDGLVDTHANDLLRYKGLLAIRGEERRLVFQGVHRMTSFDYGTPWASDEARRSCIVLIGRDLPEAALREGFAACCTPVMAHDET